MFRFILLCACFVAVAHAGGLTGPVINRPWAVQQTLTVPAGPGALAVPAIAASSANIVRGIGPVGTVLAGPAVVASPGLIAGPGLGWKGLGVGGIGLGGVGLL